MRRSTVQSVSSLEKAGSIYCEMQGRIACRFNELESELEAFLVQFSVRNDKEGNSEQSFAKRP